MANLSNINNKFIVTDGGNVLIGGTISGSSILQVTGSSTFTGDITTLANKRISIGTWDNSAFTSGNAYGFYVDSSTPMLILDETGENKTGYVGLSGGLMYVGGKVTSLTMQTGATGVNALIIDGDQKSTFTNSVTVNAGNGDQLILDNAAERFTQISLKNDGSTEGALWVDNTDNEVVLYANTGKSIEFHTNGNATPKLTISTSGTLTLTGDKTINTSNSLRLNAGGGTLFLDSGTNIILRTSGTEERIRIKANGNVGIGTTLPNAKLEVASGQAKTVTSGVEFARFGTSNDATQYATLTCEVKGGANAAARKWIFQTIEAGVANAGNIAFQPSGGNVGIGTDSPATQLEIFNSGTSVLTLSHDGGGGSGSRIDFNLKLAAVSQPVTAQIKAIDDGAFRSDIIFTTKTAATENSGLTERVKISANGRLTINNVTPPSNFAQLNIGYTAGGETRAIDIKGSWNTGESKSITFTYSTSAPSILGQINCVFNNPSASIRWGKLYYNGPGTTYTMELKSTGLTTADLTVAGSITAAGDVVAFSDKKLKKNIKTLDGSKVYKMRGVSFDRIDTGKKSSGVIAQEMQEVAPELVNESGDTLGVAYGNISGYLIEAIKELKQEIEKLKNKPCNCNCK